MSIRFFRRVRIAPGVSLNLSKSGGSVSLGPRGAKLTVGPRGKRVSAGLPGTGIYYTKQLAPAGAQATRKPAPEPASSGAEKLTLNFFQRLSTPKEEQKLVEGCQRLCQGDETGALAILQEAMHLADGAYLAGFLALRQLQLDTAALCLQSALDKSDHLGRYFAKYGMESQTMLPVTDEVVARIEPGVRGVLLGLVEVYQRLGQRQDAIACLEKLLRLDADDVVVRLSLAECLMEARPADGHDCRRVVQLAQDVQNETELHGALLLYKARALRDLGLQEAARDTLTYTLRRKKDRPDLLLRALRYERAGVYEQLRQRQRARAEYGKLYAEAPDYEDVAQRLGL